MNNNLELPFELIEFTADSPGIQKMNTMISSNDMIAVVLCTQGKVEIHIDSNEYSISKGDLYFYVPSFFTIVKDVSPDFKAIIIRTDYDFIIPLINKVTDIKSQLSIRDNPCMSLNDEQYSDIKTIINSLAERIEIENTSGFDIRRKRIMRELIISLGTTLCYEVLNTFFTNAPIQPSIQDRKDTIVQQFLISLYKNFHNERDVAFYANEQSLSPSYFSTIVKCKTGKPALQWIIEIVLVDAKQMLQYSDASIKEIAIRLNFPSQSFFGKYFKQYVGISPKNYRKKMRNER